MEATAPTILEIGTVLLLAAAAGALLRRVGLPAIVGYMAVGLLVSPLTPGYSIDREQLQLFADIGVVLLLFEVGIEIDPLKLGRERKHLLWLVPTHTVATVGVAALIGVAAGLEWKGAFILGLAIALSSSVVAVNITRSRRRITKPPTNHALLGWSVLQDLTGVALAAVLLATMGLEDRPLWWSLTGILLFGGLALASARLLPRILRPLRDQADLFLLVAVGSGLTLAAVGEELFGIPLALGAFVGGLAISESEITTAARNRLLPFRDLFAVLFFVAVGSLVEPGAIPSALAWVGLVLALVIVLKAGSIYLLAKSVRLSGVSSWQLAFALSPIGEFSFVLASVGAAEGLIAPRVYTAILTGVVTSISLAAIVVRRRPWERAGASAA